MANSDAYIVEQREDGTVAVIGHRKKKAARVFHRGNSQWAVSIAHDYAGRRGVVVFKETNGRMSGCGCSRCKVNTK
jgi:hypothetical protein